MLCRLRAWVMARLLAQGLHTDRPDCGMAIGALVGIRNDAVIQRRALGGEFPTRLQLLHGPAHRAEGLRLLFELELADTAWLPTLEDDVLYTCQVTVPGVDLSQQRGRYDEGRTAYCGGSRS